MSEYSVYSVVEKVDFLPQQLAPRPLEQAVLMVAPDEYDVLYVINPHMEGMVGTVDRAKAQEQWTRLRDVYRSIGLPVEVLPAVSGFPDMVFCANQSFPFWDENGQPTVIISRMASPYRQGEERHFDQWYEEQGYRVIRQVDEL